MPNYISQHIKNTISKKPISKSDLLPGMIVEFNYSGIENKTKKPMVIVLNPKWEGNLHGLKLNSISEITLKKLIDIVDTKYSGKLNKITKEKIEILNSNISSPISFYYGTLKEFLLKENVIDGAYREYIVSKISLLRVINYNFNRVYGVL